jgi:PAS domain S-box-containing protein
MTTKHILSYEELLAELNNLKEFEQQLASSEKKYRSLAENLNVGVYRNTPGAKGTFIEVNPAFLQIFGYKNKNSILNLNVSDLYENPSIRKKVSDKLKTQGYLKNEEVQLKKKDGTLIICSVSASAVKDTTEKIIHYDGIIEDISEKVVLRNKLVENEEKYRSIVNNSPDIIMRVDPKGTITYINFKYAGQTAEEVIGQTIYDLMPSEFHHKATDSLIKVISCLV